MQNSNVDQDNENQQKLLFPVGGRSQELGSPHKVFQRLAA